MLVGKEGIGRALPQIAGQAAHRQVHFGQLVSGAGQLLAVDGNILALPLMALHKLEGLDEHAARATAGVIDLALVGFKHLGQQGDHGLGGIELATTLAFTGGKLAEEVLIHPAHQILFGQIAFIGEGVDVLDAVDQGGELGRVQPQAGEVVIGQGIGQRSVAFLDGREGGINNDGDIILLGAGTDVAPAGCFGQEEHVVLLVEHIHIDKGLLAVGDQLCALGLELVADKFEEHQAQHHVLVFRGFHAATQLVSGIPEGLFKAFTGFLGGCFFRGGGHVSVFSYSSEK
ncbi:hypothetical protein D3C85_1061040 [compost metagenome]